MTINKNKEIRSAFMNIQDIQQEDEDLIVEGYALVFESPTVLFESNGIQYIEVIDSTALESADLSDVPFKYNHSNDFLVLARTRNKTLELTVDHKGLFIRAKLAPTTLGKDLYSLIKRGDIDKMSFAFTVAEDKYDSLTHTRRILKIDKIFDVSAVDQPAYDATNICARSYFDTQIELEKKLEEERLRKKLILMTF